MLMAGIAVRWDRARGGRNGEEMAEQMTEGIKRNAREFKRSKAVGEHARGLRAFRNMDVAMPMPMEIHMLMCFCNRRDR